MRSNYSACTSSLFKFKISHFVSNESLSGAALTVMHSYICYRNYKSSSISIYLHDSIFQIEFTNDPTTLFLHSNFGNGCSLLKPDEAQPVDPIEMHINHFFDRVVATVNNRRMTVRAEATERSLRMSAREPHRPQK